MDYATQVNNFLVVGRRYILSPELDVNTVGGAYNSYARDLQNKSHILEKKDEFIPGRFKLFFKKEHPDDFTYPQPLLIDTAYIPPGIRILFLPVEDIAATKIKHFIRRHQAKNVQQRTLNNLYSPNGIGFQKAEANWNRNRRSGGSRKRRTHRMRRSVKRQYSKDPSGIPRLRM